MPSFTSIPAARSRWMPLPDGARIGILERDDDARGLGRRASGRRRPGRARWRGRRARAWCRGSRPCARSPACSSATASACGRPPGAVAPRPTISPVAETMTQPTLGLGARAAARALRRARTASAMKRGRRSLTCRAASRASGIAVAVSFCAASFAAWSFFWSAMISASVRFERIELDVDDLRRRRGVDLANRRGIR